MERGNFSNAKGVGDGVFDYKIDFGPGYRIYFGKDGDQLVILVGGGTHGTKQRNGSNRTSPPRMNVGLTTSAEKKKELQ